MINRKKVKRRPTCFVDIYLYIYIYKGKEKKRYKVHVCVYVYEDILYVSHLIQKERVKKENDKQ